MSPESFVAIMQAWMRSKGLGLAEVPLFWGDTMPPILPEDQEREALIELTKVLDDADSINVFGGKTRQIDPETLERAIEESKKPEAKKS